MSAETEQVQGQDGDKVQKNFDSNFKKLVALFQGERNLRKSKVPHTELGAVVEELIKDKKAKAIEDFKAAAIVIMDKKVEFDKEIKKLEAEFKQKKDAKLKEFTEEMQNLFKKVEGIEQIEKSYYESLKIAGKADEKNTPATE